MTVVTIDRKKYVIVPEKQFKELQKKAAGKSRSRKSHSLSDKKVNAYKREFVDTILEAEKEIKSGKATKVTSAEFDKLWK